jgi:hypothetical protein
MIRIGAVERKRKEGKFSRCARQRIEVDFPKSGPCTLSELGKIQKAVWFRNKQSSGPAGMEKVHGLAAATRSSDIHPKDTYTTSPTALASEEVSHHHDVGAG